MNPDYVLQGAAAGVLARVVADTSVRLGVSLRALGNRALKADQKLVEWFDTYELDAPGPDVSGSLPAGVPEEALEAVVASDEFHAVVHELLAARLTDAPEADVQRLRPLLEAVLAPADPRADRPAFAHALFDFYDEQICALVGRLEGADGELLPRLRSEAFSARMVASLRAIERKLAAYDERDPEREREYLGRYRRHVVEEFGKIKPPDFERRRRVPIDDLYVSPEILPMPPAGSLLATEAISLWQLGEALDRSVLLGDPGGGKTTASGVLMHWHAQAADRRVPFLVTLREFAAQDPPERSVVGHIEHRLETFYQCPAPPGLVSRLFLAGSAVVIFDGLDELTDTTRRAEVTAIVERFCSEYPMVRVLVTSRLVGYDQARLDEGQFRCYRIDGFDQQRVRTYVARWFAQEEGICRTDAEGLAASFMTESESIPDLRANPLMLALLCILYRGEGYLPRNRPEVYEQCANLLFHKWDARRKIHTELRARRYVEPALRHLAHWMFVRQEQESAVTERELIRQTADFLHGRGFESAEDAREAAEEFVAFCRGRAWVFSDAGTTSTGEKLYTFTHRTFLEYFTAGYLARAYDTPEQLAKELAPRIIKQEWPVVAELALQMKDGMADQGAERFYRSLLGDKRYRAAESSKNLLSFLASALASVDPPPAVVRELCRRCLDHFFLGPGNEALYHQPLGLLASSGRAYLPALGDEYRKYIDEVVATGDEAARTTALSLAIQCFGVPARAGAIEDDVDLFWTEFAEESRRRYGAEYAAAAGLTQNLTYEAARQGGIPPAELLAGPDDFQELMNGSYETGVFGIGKFPLLFTETWHAMDASDSIAPGRMALLRRVGEYLSDDASPPWTRCTGTAWPPSSRLRALGAATVQLDGTAFLGAAIPYLISVEWTEDPAVRTVQPESLGALAPLHPYVARRLGIDPDAELPALPVRADMQALLEAWADGRQDFVIKEAKQSPPRLPAQARRSAPAPASRPRPD